MRARDVLRPFRHRGELVDVQRRGVGEQQRARLHHLIELGEDRLLDVHFLEHRLDDDIAVLDVVVARQPDGCGRGGGPSHLVQAAALDPGRVVDRIRSMPRSSASSVASMIFTS